MQREGLGIVSSVGWGRKGGREVRARAERKAGSGRSPCFGRRGKWAGLVS